MRRVVFILTLAGCGNPKPPPYPLPPLADIVRTCLMEVSCLSSPPLGGGVSDCVRGFQTSLAAGQGIWWATNADLARFVACASASADCTAALTCASRGHGPAYCQAHPGASCDGDVAVSCSSPDWSINNTDCAALGLHCQTANGAASCTDGTPCDPQNRTETCDGNRIVECNSLTRLSSPIDCEVYERGSSCVVTEIGALCLRTPDSCPACDPGKSCGAMSFGDVCDGDSMVVCAGGAPVTVPCASIGLGTCTTIDSRVACR